MTHVRLHRRGEACGIPDDNEFLMVIPHEVDAHGEWLPSTVRAVRTLPQLKEALRETAAATGGIVLQASGQFEPLATELGLMPLTSEWGRL